MQVSSTEAWTAERITQADRDYVIHSWATQGQVEARAIAGGQGAWFWDYEGNRFLDFQSQLVSLNLGHQHPRLIEAIQQQAAQMCYIGPGFAERSRSQLAERIAAVTPGDLTMTFFTTGGAAANENAVRLARHATGRDKVVARYRSYHGATAGALALTGDPRHHAGGASLPGVVRMLDPYTYRCPAGHPDPCPVCTGGPHLRELLDYEDPETVAAVIVEPVVGTNGVIYPPDGYLQQLREVCDEHGILLIFDEVMVGFGRTGEWFACDHWSVVPDIMTTAKGLNSGYVPLGAMTVSPALGDWLRTNKFWGGLTYSGHPLACASGLASIDVIEEDDLVGNSAAQGERLASGLTKLAARHPCVGEARGRGLYQALELVTDRETRAPLVPYGASGQAAEPMRRITGAAMQAGLYVAANFNVLRLAPPLIVSGDEVNWALEVLDEVLELGDALVE